MEKLKTLEDMDYCENTANLREEAIKWIKAIRKMQLEHAEFIINDMKFNYSKEREDWIKIFFNIKENEI